MGDRMNDSQMAQAKASVGFLPAFSGDGYGYGGGVVLTIGDTSILLGEGYMADWLAQEIAARWNTPAKEPAHDD